MAIVVRGAKQNGSAKTPRAQRLAKLVGVDDALQAVLQ
jgi:hypothetical protein